MISRFKKVSNPQPDYSNLVAFSAQIPRQADSRKKRNFVNPIFLQGTHVMVLFP